MSDFTIKTKQALNEIIGEPIDFVKEKVSPQLDEEMKEL
jgi:hypothetical protein